MVNNNNKSMVSLVCILASALTIEVMEELQETDVYRHEVKRTGKMFLRELEKHTAEFIPLVWGIKDELMYTIMESQKSLVRRLVSLDAHDAEIVEVLIDKYMAHKEEMLKYLGIVVDEQKPILNTISQP